MENNEEQSAFDVENIAPVVVISLARIYDLLAVIARGVNQNEAEKMIELHSQGYTLSPPPSFRPMDNLPDE